MISTFSKKELRELIKRRLGYPIVKVELHDSQIDDAIMAAREQYLKWAVGTATTEVFFTLALSADVGEYEMPSGVTEVVSVKEFDTAMSGINTLFSVQNYLYNQGVFSFLNNVGNYSMVDYHLALDFMDLLDRYSPDYYIHRYNKVENTLILKPTPSATSTSVGYLIIDSYMLADTDETTRGPVTDSMFNVMWGKTWVQDYATARAKYTLGLIRRKFASFQSIGTEGISLDGDSLVSEAKDEMTDLMERIKLDEISEGWGITLG